MSDKEGILLSASQIALKRRCFRSWGYNYIHGFKPPQSKAAALGTAVHEQLARWLKSGTLPDDSFIGRVALAGLSLLPAPQESLVVEEKFYLRTEKADFVGFIDLLHPTKKPNPLIVDHKTTKDFRWVKTESELLEDPQAILYAQHVLSSYKKKAVDLEWVYYKTTGKNEAKKTSTTFDLTTIAKPFTNILRDAEEMISAHKAKTEAKNLAPSYDACEAFGGCPHKERCFNMSNPVLEKLKAQRAKQQAEKATGINPPVQEAIETAEKNQLEFPMSEPKKEEKEIPAAKTPLIVLLDVLPAKGAFSKSIQLSELFFEVAKVVAAQHKVADYRLLEYAQGAPLVALAFDEYVTKTGLSGSVFADSFSHEWKTVGDVLMRHADIVLRGV